MTLYRWIDRYEANGLRGLGRAKAANAGELGIWVSRVFDRHFARITEPKPTRRVGVQTGLTYMVDIQPIRRRSQLSLVVGYFGRVAAASVLIGFWAFMAVKAFEWVTARF